MKTKKIGVIGSGMVGQTLANGFVKHGYEVMLAARDPKKLEDWKKATGEKAATGTFPEAAKFGEVLVLAVKGDVAENALSLCGEALNGKVVIDTTNPISSSAPPEKGVLQFFTDRDSSLMERLQAKAPQARLVKAFSSVGAALMVDPRLPSTPSMFIAGNDAAAKETVRGILEQFGWEAEDMGGVEAARAIEPLCILWCIPGFLRNDWTHAFKVLRP